MKVNEIGSKKNYTVLAHLHGNKKSFSKKSLAGLELTDI